MRMTQLNKKHKTYNYLHSKLLSEETKEKGEKLIVIIAIISFFIHLITIYLIKYGIIRVETDTNLLTNPIGAIYTPFSFIIIYEVYLLIYYLPKSITGYIGKQYEIITLIIIRRLFKDLATMEISSKWFHMKGDLQFSFDLIATIVLFFLIYLFYLVRNSGRKNKPEQNFETTNFIRQKKAVALFLVPVFIGLSIYSIYNWLHNANSLSDIFESMKYVNNIFFNDFFTILILVDVLLLLLSLFYTDKFNIVIRNSGFIISTILIRLSFGTEGFMNPVLIFAAVIYGILLLYVSNQFEYKILPSNRK